MTKDSQETISKLSEALGEKFPKLSMEEATKVIEGAVESIPGSLIEAAEMILKVREMKMENILIKSPATITIESEGKTFVMRAIAGKIEVRLSESDDGENRVVLGPQLHLEALVECVSITHYLENNVEKQFTKRDDRGPSIDRAVSQIGSAIGHLREGHQIKAFQAMKAAHNTLCFLKD